MDFMERLRVWRWQLNGKKGATPHSVKEDMIRSLKEKYHLTTLVETGTYQGDMVEAMKNDFEHVYSIELSKEFAWKAKKRFQSEKNITILQGDSATVISKLVKKLKKPALFWLDAHFSGGNTAQAKKDTPIEKELQVILNHKVTGNVVLIDDAVLFVGKNDYPTLSRVKEVVLKKYPASTITVENDAIEIVLKK